MDGASEPAREAPRMDNRFRARCASALMHPATVTAVALLLLNDLVFKSVWPGSWATGKLSDLAWVVFASPLLAFLLSFLVRRSTVGQRVAFIASYAALPLLYAAFNTFGPVHDLIIRGLSIASGGTSGSPLDVTDSLVIPFGLGIALWVWRRRIASTESLRMRLAVLAAGVAALASVATSESQPDFAMGRRWGVRRFSNGGRSSPPRRGRERHFTFGRDLKYGVGLRGSGYHMPSARFADRINGAWLAGLPELPAGDSA